MCVGWGGVCFKKIICSSGLSSASDLLHPPAPPPPHIYIPRFFSFYIIWKKKKKCKSLVPDFCLGGKEQSGKATRGHSRTESWRVWVGPPLRLLKPCMCHGGVHRVLDYCPPRLSGRGLEQHHPLFLSLRRVVAQEKGVDTVLQPEGSRSWLN